MVLTYRHHIENNYIAKNKGAFMKNSKNKRQTNIIFNALYSPEDEIKKYTHLLGK